MEATAPVSNSSRGTPFRSKNENPNTQPRSFAIAVPLEFVGIVGRHISSLDMSRHDYQSSMPLGHRDNGVAGRSFRRGSLAAGQSAMALSRLNGGGESAMQVEIKLIGVFEAGR
jgi:hypothetical protein